MDLNKLEMGDFITHTNIPVGEYQGMTEIEIDGHKLKLVKVFESKKGVMHQLPVEKVKEMEALPKREYFKKSLKLLGDPSIGVLPKHFKTTRYEYIKNLSQKAGLRPYLKTLKILFKLSEQKTITLAERKLLKKFKERFYTDVETILGESKAKAESYLQFAL